MRAVVSTSELAGALKACGVAVAGRPNIPALGGVLITPTDQGLVFDTNDQDTYVKALVSCQVDQTPPLLVSHRLLAQCVAAASKPLTELTVEHGAFVVRSGAEWSLPQMRAQEYPIPPKLPSTPVCTLDGVELATAVRAVAVASDPEVASSLPMSSIFLGFRPDAVDVVATDRRRLHHTAVMWLEAGTIPSKPWITVPASSIGKLVDPLFGRCEILADDNLASFACPSYTVTTRQTAMDGGKWAAWEPYFVHPRPANVATRVVVDKADWLRAIRQALVLQEADETKGQRLSMKVTEDTIEFRSTSDGRGASMATVDAVIEGRPLRMVFRSDYLTGVAPMIDGDEIEMSVWSPKQPALFNAPGEPTAVVAGPTIPPTGVEVGFLDEVDG